MSRVWIRRSSEEGLHRKNKFYRSAQTFCSSTRGTRFKELLSLVVLVSCLASLPANAEPERDPFLSHVDPGVLLRGFDEQYNPYSGQFVARFLTASLPGKGGHDLNVYLYYSTEVWNRTDEGIMHSASPKRRRCRRWSASSWPAVHIGTRVQLRRSHMLVLCSSMDPRSPVGAC